MIRFDDASFHYGGEHGTGEGVDHIDLAVHDGELVVLVGASGCGKTTLTRLANGLAPQFFEGEMEGAVYVDDLCTTSSELAQTASVVGSVFQNPKSQFFNLDTTGELAFGCENHALSREEIRARVDLACDHLKLDALMDRNIFDLSGGEKQQIACGSVYATAPRAYVLDEPSSNLDRKAMHRLHEMLVRVKEQGAAILVSEHRLHYLMDIADRFVYLDDGRIVREFTSSELSALDDDAMRRLGLRCTALERIPYGCRQCGRGASTLPAIEAVDLSCNRGGTQIIDIERLALPDNSIVALIGDNGSGKSTLSEALCGVGHASGSISFDGVFLDERQRSDRSFMVMQDVNRQLFCPNVLEEVMLNAHVDAGRAYEVLARLGIDGVADRHPASLSGGQKQRVAIASALCAGKQVIFYDEPTSGLDRAGMESFAELVDEMARHVQAQVIVTHDPELIMRACTHALRIENGRVMGIYPLDEHGAERVRYYFLSADDGSSSRKRNKRSAVGRILSYAGARKRTIMASAVLTTLGAACSIVPYLAVWRIIDAVLAGQEVALAGFAAHLAVICAALLGYAVLYTNGLTLSHEAAYATLENIRCSLQEKLEAQPLGTVQAMGSGAAKKLFADDIDSIELLLAHMIPEGVANIAVVLASLLAMCAADWRLALLTMLMVGFGISATARMYAVGTDRMGSYFAAGKRLNNVIVEYVEGMEAVRMFNRMDDSFERFGSTVRSYRDFALAWYGVCWPWMAACGSIFSNCALYALPFGALFVLTGSLALSQLVLALCLCFAIAPLLVHVVSFAGALPQVDHKIQALEKALDRPPLHVDDAGFTGASYDVSLQDVHFGYGNDEVLKGVSLTAREGGMCALVGASGSGKSTIAKLIAHHLDVESGSVMVGGQDVRSMSLEALSGIVSYVSQDLFLFNDTIFENIRVGRPDATDEEVREAARRAQCDELASSLQKGYLTMAGASGAALSGGQRQRIAFARALLKDAPIVVLDEATASIDPENAERMNAAIAELCANKTVIVIAHRLRSIARADSIVVLEEGRVAAQGTHAELLAGCPEYRELWDASERAEGWALAGGETVA